MMLIGGLLILAAFFGALWRISNLRKEKNGRRRLRASYTLTPEEREAHFNGLRRKISAERKAAHTDDDSEEK